jgi:hypothetical protein
MTEDHASTCLPGRGQDMMPEFWVASGHHLTRLDARGRMLVTDELLLAWLARPE